MKSHPLKPFAFVVLVLIAVGAVTMMSKRFTGDELVPWGDNFPAARQTARAQHKPILLYFTASWCGPCQEMRKRVWTDRSVADAMKSVVPVRIDIDQNQQLAHDYHIETIPTFFIMDENGNILRSVGHAMEAEEFVAWLKGQQL